jgi:hypothetical protein
MRWLRAQLTSQQIDDVQAWLDLVVLPRDAIRPQTGWYWDPGQPDRGFFVEYAAGQLSIAAFHYADDGRSDWAVGSLRYDGSVRELVLPLSEFRDGQTLTGAWQPVRTAGPPLVFELLVDDALRLSLRGAGSPMALQRLGFDLGTVPILPVPGSPHSGWWWNPDEPGRGYTLEFQGDALYIVAYLFDDDGRPAWVTSFGRMQNLSRYCGRWQRFADGQTLRGPWRPARLIDADAGELQLDFQSLREAQLTLPDGRRTPIRRLF